MCGVWCWLLGCMFFFLFFLGSIDMYRCTSHSISVPKSCGGVVGSWLVVGGCCWTIDSIANVILW